MTLLLVCVILLAVIAGLQSSSGGARAWLWTAICVIATLIALAITLNGAKP